MQDLPEEKKPKFVEKLEKSILTIDISDQVLIEQLEREQVFSYFTFSDLIRFNKNIFAEIIQQYQPLLASLNLNDSDSGKNGNSGKDSLKQIFMDSIGVKTDKIKLSDFIDDAFFDDMEDVQGHSDYAKSLQSKLSLESLVFNLKNFSQRHYFNFSQFMQKRQKLSSNQQYQHKYIILGPQLALLMHFSKMILADDWKIRQSACNFLRNLILNQKHENLEYFVVGVNRKGEMLITENTSIKIEEIILGIIPQLIIMMLKDQFNDYEELKVLTPAREEGLMLMVKIQEFQFGNENIQKEFQSLLQLMPNILKSVEIDQWISRYNFFLILKSLVKNQKSMIFQIFSRVLIESLVKVEDEVMILITELIQSMIEMYLQQKDYYFQIQILLRNLQENLKQSDEIDASSISVFSLMQTLLDLLPQNFANEQKPSQFEFKLDLQTICPFNFHKIVNVRYSYNSIIQKCLLSSKQMSIFSDETLYDHLYTLFRLNVQSLVMERSKEIVKVLLFNIKAFVNKFKEQNLCAQYLLLLDEISPFLWQWIMTYQIKSFETFLFFESDKFESLNQDYYKIVYQPFTPEEISQFYFGKMKNLTNCIALMMMQSPEASYSIVQNLERNLLVISEQDMQTEEPKNLLSISSSSQIIQPVHEFHLVYLIVLKRCIEECEKDQIPPSSIIDLEYVNKIALMFMTQMTEEVVSIFNFRDIESLQMNMQNLWVNLAKNNLQNQIVSLFQLMDQCLIDQKLTNLPLIQQQVELLTQLLGSIQIPEIQECLRELIMQFTSLFIYASQSCTRIKSQAAILHLLYVKNTQNILTNQLNNIIKPLLNQIKTEKVEFLQEQSSEYLILLLDQLTSTGKIKTVQQILGIIIKSLYEAGMDSIQDRGNSKVLRFIIKNHENLLSSYNRYIFAQHFQIAISKEDFVQWTKATLFIMKIIKDCQSSKAYEVYKDFSLVIVQQVCFILANSAEYEQFSDLPQLVKITFELFLNDEEKLVLEIVKQMVENKNKNAFDSLIELLNSSSQSNRILRYIPVFIIPVIQSIQYSRRIYGDDKQVTQILAQLLTLLPLNLTSLSDLAARQELEESKSELSVLAQEGYNFLQVFVNNQIGQNAYQLQIKVKAQLRDYQKQGINWMASLGKYNLNCALCDDMGLGKTIQSLCVVLNESFIRNQGLSGKKSINMIVCPTTITHNWNYEISKFFNGFKSVVYEGSTSQKDQIVKDLKKFNYDVVIMSYEKLRNELKNFQDMEFFYLILDEAHIIKNPKAKTTLAVKQINCQKKIALSGTPLQNRVSELWSIFDFLMPGFLEEEQVFNKKYNQYLTTNIKKLSEKLEETQSFVEALKSLKKRIQPFILRRTKDQVLKELPPKIIQDVICEMTPFQEYTHSLIEKKFPIQQQLQQEDQKLQKAGKQILQNLILHRKVCNHPMLVTDNQDVAKDKNIIKHVEKKSSKELIMYENSGKLIGLYDKLVECEVIENVKSSTDGNKKEESKSATKESNNNEASSAQSLLIDMAQVSLDINQISNINAKHRVLIFCQMKSYQKMIVDQILNRYKVPYLQILSDHSAKDRLDICNRFNGDESIRVLILTTQIGGLGLNLTGADTVIFAEHDWNPMRDLQAIDRAHRIGQTRQVNVYRLIVKGTIEEKIMGLQRFKENLAKSLVQARGIGQEEASSLEVSDLLKSFQEHSAFNEDSQKKSTTKQQGKIKDPTEIAFYDDKVLSNLDDIWKGANFENEDL